MLSIPRSSPASNHISIAVQDSATVSRRNRVTGVMIAPLGLFAPGLYRLNAYAPPTQSSRVWQCLAIAIRSFSALGEREQLRISEPPSVTVGRLVRTDPIVRSSSRLANCRVLMNRLTPHATRVSIGANEPVVNRESALKVAATRVSAITCARWRRKRVLKRGATPSTSESGASPTRHRASVSVQRFA